MFPEAGGQYVFMREAYGGFTAFLYGWVLFTAGNSAALASMGIAVALFLGQAIPSLAADHVSFRVLVSSACRSSSRRGSVIAVASVVLITAINLRSVKVAAWLQNLTALAYLVAVLGIVAVGFALGTRILVAFPLRAEERLGAHHGGGHRRRNDPAFLQLRRLGISVVGRRRDQGAAPKSAAGVDLRDRADHRHVSACQCRLPLCADARAACADRRHPAAAAMGLLFSSDVGRWLSLFIAAISFGGASVTVLGGARIYYSMAKDGAFFAGMTRLHPRWKTPVTSLIAQCAWVCVLISRAATISSTRASYS